MITIVRDPIDLLSSYISMDALYNREFFDSFLSSPEEHCFSDWFTDNDMDIVDNFNIIVKYESLTNSPFETVKQIADKMSIKITENRYESTLVNQEYRHHVVSSKNLEEYSRIRKIVEKQDLTRAYEIYNKFLTKAI